MLSKDNYEKLKNSFGTYGSWAIWDNPSDKNKPKSNIEGMEWATEPFYEKLNDAYVFVGLNSSVHENENVKTWSAFHSSDTKRSHDHRIRNVLSSTKFWGSYMTDIIKNFPKTKLETGDLNEEVLSANKELFIQELSCLNQNVKIIAFGITVYEILKDMDLGGREVVKIPHFACRLSNEEYYRQTKEILKNI